MKQLLLLFSSLPILAVIIVMFVEKSNLNICSVVKSQLSEDSVSGAAQRHTCVKVMRSAFAVRWIF